MPPYIYNRPVADGEYVQRVRRHSPSSLLPLVAAAAAKYGAPERPAPWLSSPFRKYTPWALADVARVSLVSGNEHRSSRTTERDLLEMLAAYSALDDPFRSAEPTTGSLMAFLLRTSGEQLTWQEPDYNTHGRTTALLCHTSPVKEARCIKPGWEADVFGCTIEQYVCVTQLLWGSALQTGGWFDPAWLDTQDAAPMRQRISRDELLRVVDQHFLTTVQDFRERERIQHQRSHAPFQLRRFDFNPLRGRPVLAGFGPKYLCPSPQLSWAKASPAGIYYTAWERYGGDFATDLGDLFEQYVGRNLRLIPNVEVFPEINYKRGRGECKSVDWFVVFDDLVLLVEVKSTMPTNEVRLGTHEAVPVLLRKLKHAYTQINISAERVLSGDAAFREIPNDRPVLGMVVTLEPFHLANAPFQRQLFPETTIPVTVASASELEALVTISDQPISSLLLDLAADHERSTWSVSTALGGHEHRNNPVMDAGWAASRLTPAPSKTRE